MNYKLPFLFTSGILFLLFACNQPNNTNQVNSAVTPVAEAKFANENDFVCGMKVLPDYTDTCHYQGKVYGFCSQSCKEEFQAAPETYLKK